jgi:hypothetical protein
MLRSTKPPKCKHCGIRTDGLPLHMECVGPWWAKQREKKARAMDKKLAEARRNEKRRIKARLEEMETPKQLLPKAQKAVNRWCRFRDLLAGRGCISCGATFRTAFGGVFDAGHFRSVGSAGHLRFFTKQIRLQCVRCNRDLSGNATEFRKGMVALFGVAEVERIEAMYWTAKWTVDYLRRLIRVATKRANRLEKRWKEQEA